ncbi:PadR family transcriptional regulator [Nonomuraea rubra]|uniref:PadR family transcriptional regulator n=1 Tax=Nonomuraea rubra TaxID=46180 RepID=UPI0033EB78E4
MCTPTAVQIAPVGSLAAPHSGKSAIACTMNSALSPIPDAALCENRCSRPGPDHRPQGDQPRNAIVRLYDDRSICPTLQLLEDEGLVRVEPADGRKAHYLTAEGRRVVEEQAREIERLWARAASRGEWGMLREPEAAEIIAPRCAWSRPP